MADKKKAVASKAARALSVSMKLVGVPAFLDHDVKLELDFQSVPAPAKVSNGKIVEQVAAELGRLLRGALIAKALPRKKPQPTKDRLTVVNAGKK